MEGQKPGGDYEFKPMDEWEPIDHPALRDAPFRLFLRTFKSSEDETEGFLHNPLAFMRGEEVDSRPKGEGRRISSAPLVIEDEEGNRLPLDKRHAMTFLTNHEAGLFRMPLYTFALVPLSEEDDWVALMLYKQPPEPEPEPDESGSG